MFAWHILNFVWGSAILKSQTAFNRYLCNFFNEYASEKLKVIISMQYKEEKVINRTLFSIRATAHYPQKRITHFKKTSQLRML